MSELEDKYLDVLQNIEFAIVTTYHENPGLTDYDADKALKKLILNYRSEGEGRGFTQSSPSGLSDIVFERVKTMCEWRLGRESAFVGDSLDEENRMVNFNPRSLNLDEVILCLKRISKSIEKWNKRGGRQGYLNFIEQYVK